MRVKFSPTDFRRWLTSERRYLEKISRPHNFSIGFEEWDGTDMINCAPTGNTPEELKLIGGIVDPLSGQIIGPPNRPYHTIKFNPQQRGPMLSKASIICIFGGQRSGKSYCARNMCMARAIEKPRIIYYLFPKYQKAEEILERYLRTDYPDWIEKDDKKNHVFTLINGTRIHIWSGAPGNDDSFLGGECDDFYAEEAREMKSKILPSALSRIFSRNGRMVIATSPETDHIIEDISNGQYDGAQVDVFHLSTKKNFFWMQNKEHSTKVFDLARKFYDDRKYQRDIEGEFVADAGKDFYNFDKDVHVIDQIIGTPCTRLLWRSELWLSQDAKYTGESSLVADPRLEGKDTLIGMDFGATVCSAIAAAITVEKDPHYLSPDHVNFEDANLIIHDEMQLENTSVLEFTQTVLMRKYPPTRAVIFCDSSGQKRESTTGQTPVALLQRLGYVVFFINQTRREGLDAVRSRLHLRKLFFMRTKTAKLQEHVTKVSSYKKTLQAISTDPYGHLPDCLRYLVTNIFPMRALFYEGSKYLPVLQNSYSQK